MSVLNGEELDAAVRHRLSALHKQALAGTIDRAELRQELSLLWSMRPNTVRRALAGLIKSDLVYIRREAEKLQPKS